MDLFSTPPARASLHVAWMSCPHCFEINSYVSSPFLVCRCINCSHYFVTTEFIIGSIGERWIPEIHEWDNKWGIDKSRVGVNIEHHKIQSNGRKEIKMDVYTDLKKQFQMERISIQMKKAKKIGFWLLVLLFIIGGYFLKNK